MSMKRDWDVIRELLTEIESETLPAFVNKLHREVQFGKGDAVCESEVARQLKLLVDAGYVADIQFGGMRPGMVSYVRIEPELTMEGYDLLECLCSEGVQTKALRAYMASEEYKARCKRFEFHCKRRGI